MDMETRIENLLELGVDGGRKKTTSSCLHLLGPRIPGNPKFPNFCLIIHKSPSEQGNRSFYTRYKIPIELNPNLGNASMQQRNVRVLFSLWSHGRKEEAYLKRWWRPRTSVIAAAGRWRRATTWRVGALRNVRGTTNFKNANAAAAADRRSGRTRTR